MKKRLPKTSSNDDKLIPLSMLLMDHGFRCFSYERITRFLAGKKHRRYGTGFLNTDPEYYRRIYIEDGLVYKIWEPEFLWKDYMPGAILANFYGKDLTPALIGLIIDDVADIRGYVMEECRIVVSPHDYARMMNLLMKKTQETRWCFPDCIKQNMGWFNGQMTLLDLENVQPISNSIKTAQKVYDKCIHELDS